MGAAFHVEGRPHWDAGGSNQSTISMPSIMTGIRNGLSLAWMFMVAAELIAATRGLGYLLTDGREMGRADIVLAAIVLLALLGKVTDTGMAWLERRLLAWRDTYDTAARG